MDGLSTKDLVGVILGGLGAVIVISVLARSCS